MLATPPIVPSRLGASLVSMSRWNKVALMISADLISLPLCFTIAMLLRLGSFDFIAHYSFAPNIFIALATILVFAITGLYGAIIRFIDQRLLATTGAGLAIVVLAVYVLSSYFGTRGIPQNALMIYWFIAFSYVVSSRLLARNLLRQSRSVAIGDISARVAIYGAGMGGSKLAEAMRASGKYVPVCFFDDKRALDNRNVAGLKVYHSAHLVKTVNQRRIGLIVIAIPSATPEQRMQIMYRAQMTGAKVKILSNLMEMTDREINSHSIREIKIEDLLGRKPIQPQIDLFAKCVRGQNILVTGAGGSIGSELCRQIMTQSPREVHLLDHSEHNLYNIEQELALHYPEASIHPHLGSVCDAILVERIVCTARIDTIYHAAAYKHVPLVEHNLAEGVRNNVLGAEAVANAAGKFHVKTCVLVSTDKAVRPTSMMGASKRVAELIFQGAAIRYGGWTKFCMVRFGNVLGSSGSVVPLFLSQIERGGPVTITDREVVRYFMSITEAAQLVMQAGAMATGGDVFVMDMGEPVKIVDLARTMIAMCGLTEKSKSNPNGDIEIQFIGLRPGEKLYEELFAGNDAIPSKHPRIMTTTEYVIEPDALSRQVAYLLVACSTNDKVMIRNLVSKLVVGYKPSQTDDSEASDQVAATSAEVYQYPFVTRIPHRAMAADG